MINNNNHIYESYNKIKNEKIIYDNHPNSMGYLQLSAVICVYLQLSAVICGYLRLSAVLVCAASIRMVVVLMLVRLWKAYVCTYIPSSHETDDNNKNKNDNDSNDNDDDNDDV